jgi:hypothetical protein
MALKFAKRTERIRAATNDRGLADDRVLLRGNKTGAGAAKKIGGPAKKNKLGAPKKKKKLGGVGAKNGGFKYLKTPQTTRPGQSMEDASFAQTLARESFADTGETVPRARALRKPEADEALGLVGRPPRRGSGASVASSVSSVSSMSVASSAGLSTASSASSRSASGSSSASAASNASSRSGSGADSRSGVSSLSSLSTVSSVSVDKGFDILRGTGGARGGARGGAARSAAGARGGAIPSDTAEEAEKLDILARFHALKQRGVALSKNYTPRSSLAELRLEMGRIEHEQTVSRSVQRLRRWLLAFVSGAQYATDSRYAPRVVHGKLNGFSDYVLASVEDYDAVFERIAEENAGVYGIGSTGSPFGDLAILLCTQLLMFVFMSSKPGVKPPSAEEIRREHPDLVRQVAQELAVEMRERERAEERATQARANQFYTGHAGSPGGVQNSIPLPPMPVPRPGPMPVPSPGPVPPAPNHNMMVAPSPMPAPTLDFSGVAMVAPPRKPRAAPSPVAPASSNSALESLHASASPAAPWVSVGETLLPELAAPAPLPPLPPLPPPPPPPMVVPHAGAVNETTPGAGAETFPQPPPAERKVVELPEVGVSTRRGRAPKLNPMPTSKAAIAAAAASAAAEPAENAGGSIAADAEQPRVLQIP